MKMMLSGTENPLLRLEVWADSPIYDQRQVGFCSQWSLDNICMSLKLRTFYPSIEYYN